MLENDNNKSFTYNLNKKKVKTKATFKKFYKQKH